MAKGRGLAKRDCFELLESRRLMAASVGGSVDVALIDSSLPNFAQLQSAVADRSKIITFDGRRDSANKILGKLVAWATANRTEIRSLSILSHGSAGRFALGNEWISTRHEDAKAWSRLRKVMTDKANIYLFGCNVASEKSDGQTLLNHLATLSGADVFASTNLTGSKRGDWVLEAASSGADRTAAAAPINTRSLSQWDFTLAAGITVIPTSGLITTEAPGGTDTFTVVLDEQPTDDVIIPLSSSNPAEGNPDQVSLLFTPANWDTPQTVTAIGADDDIDDGDVTYDIILDPAISDATYLGIDATDVSVTNQDDDTAGITVTPTSGLTTTEAGVQATFDVVLNSQPTDDVTIVITSGDTSEGTIPPTTLTFTAGDWNVAQTVTITGANDGIDDGDIPYTIIIDPASSTDPKYDLLDASDVSVTNTDNDTAGITVTPTSGLTTTEAGGQATFDVVLNCQPTDDVTIAISSGDLTEGTVSTALLTFTSGNWNLPQTVTITGVNDAVDDGDIAYTITTGAAASLDPAYANLDAADVSVTNTDNDTAGITVTPTSGLTTTETGGQATFDVVLDSQPTGDVTIGISTSDATEGTVSVATLTFTAGNWNVAQTVTITGVNDAVDDGDIGYTIITAAASSADGNYNNRNAADVSVTNTDNDTAGITVNPTSGLTTTEGGATAGFTVVLDSQPTADVTIGISSLDLTEGTVSASSLTFTAGNWNVAQTVTITGVNDFVDDGDIAYTIQTAAASSADGNYNNRNAADVSVTNTDNDTAGITVNPTSGLTTTEGGATAGFTIVLDSQPTADVTIGISSLDLTEGTVSASSLTFTAGNWNVAQTVTITGVNDFVDDGDIAYTIQTAAASSGDANYNNMNVSDVGVTNTDNDTAGVTVSPTSGLSTTEGGATAGFTVVLDSQPTADVTIGISSSDLTEGTVSTSLLTFTAGNWNVPQTVTITGVNDPVDDDNIAYTIMTAAASSSDANYNNRNASDVSITNIDNDTAGFTISPLSGLTTAENGATAGFTVVLDSQPTADVTLAIASGDTSEGTISTSSLTFTAANWNIPQAVVVTGVNDAVDDGDVAYSIVTDPASSSDPKYDTLNPANVSVTNTDDDTAGITVSPTSGLIVTEAGSQATYTVVLTSQPTADVTIAVNSGDATEGSVSTNLLTFTAGDWNVPQTVTVTGVDDFEDDGNVSFSIVNAAASSADPNYNTVDPSDVGVTTINDDTAGIIVSPTSGLTTTEAGSSVTFDVVLKTKPSGQVTIGISSGDATEGTVSTASLTFGPGDWDVPQTVTVTAVDDILVDGNITYSIITAPATSTDGKYNGLNASDVSVTNDDNDPNGTRDGVEFRINTTTNNNQQTFFESPRAIAMDANGNFVVTWSSLNQDGSGWGVYAQRFDRLGVALGAEFRVNTVTNSDQQYSRIAMDVNGNFVITWTSNLQDGSGWGIYAQRYNSLGVAQGANFRVNSTTAADQKYPSIAMDPTGRFVIGWVSTGQDGSGNGIYAQRFNSSGVAQGGEFRVNTSTANDQQESSIAMDASGNFVIVWASDLTDGDNFGVYGQRYNSAGVAQGAQFRVNTTTFKNQRYPTVAMDSAGNFVVTWSGEHQDGPGNFWGVFSQRFNSAGVAVGVETQVNSSVARDQLYSAIAMDTTGNYVITFSGNQRDGSGWGVFAKQYDNTGAARGGEFRVNTATAGDQFYSSAAMDANGDYAIVWTSANQDGSGYGVYAQRYSGGNDAPVNTIPGAQSVNEDATLVFSAGNGNQISVSDVDAGTASLQVTLTATNGTMTLSGTTGLTFSSGDGSADTTMTFTGTLIDINAALNGLSYSPTANFNGAASIQIVTNDLGNTGWDAAQSDTDTVSITVNPVNDAPVNSVPGAQTMNEDATLTLAGGNAISISDIDAGSGSVRVTLLASNGTMTLAQTTGLTFTSGDGTADATMTFTGTTTAINNALNGLTFTPTLNYNGAASIQITTNDLGNTGSGGSLVDTDVVNITVNAVNDAPVNTVPAAQTTNEDTTLVFSTANSNRISIGDVDAGTNSLRVTLTVTNGTLTLSGTSGLTFTTGDGIADTTMTFTGNQTNINAALDGLSFAPTANYNGAASLQIVTNDQGNSGSGGSLSDTDTVAITVVAVNDAPVNTVPGAQVIDEDTPLVFSTANSNVISVADVDAGTSSIRVTLTAAHGTLTLSGTSGLTFTAGDGTADVTMTFTGNTTDINTALNGLVYMPAANYHGGGASVQITTNDLGQTGAGGAQVDTDAVAVSINSVNDGPVNTVPGPQTINEDTNLVFSTANGNRISIDDLDADPNPMRITLTATNGTLTLNGTTGLTFITGDGTGDATMIFTGVETEVNAALDGLIFTPNANFNGAASIQIVTNDQGNTGAGSAISDTDAVAITVNPINDAPVNSVPVAQSTNEDTTLVFSTANSNRISIADVDAATGALRVTLTSTNGTLTLAGTTGLTFIAGDGTADATMTFTGTLVDINAALDGLAYAPTANYNGPASVQITTSDQGNSGAGGTLIDSDTVNVTVIAVNDPPVNTVPAAQSVDEDAVLTFSSGGANAISISDLDAASGIVKVTLTGTNGTITLGGTTGLTFLTGDGSADASMSFTGTIADINTALEGLTFAPTPDFAGAASLQITTDDQGNAGLGGAQVDTDVIAITVNGVNDAPINTIPSPQNVDEDTTLVFSSGIGNAISISDIDAAAGLLRVTLTATNGVISLSGTTGLTFIAGDGAADATMTFTGTVANINTALDGLSYTPATNYNGPATIQIITSDQGNTGLGGALSDTDTVSITVDPVNDAPVVSVAGAQNVSEDSSLIFSSGNGNLISVADVDVASGLLEITLTATNGVLSLNGTTGLIFTTGDGTADATLVFTGTLANVNAALNGLIYSPNANYNGPATIQITADDQANTGSGGALTDTQSIAVTVGAVNDAPVLSGANDLPNIDEDDITNTGMLVSGLIAGQLSDIDAGALAGIAVIGVDDTNGTWEYSTDGGGNWFAFGAVSDSSARLLAADANTRVRFVPNANFNGTVAAGITFRGWDQTSGVAGSTADASISGGTTAFSSAQASASINVDAVNDAPVVSVPVAQNVDEDSTLIFSSGNGNLISIADVDVASGLLKITITATNGVLTLNGTTGLTFTTGDGTADATLVFTGTLANVNAALNGMAYSPNANYNGPATIQITADDQANTGSGGALSDTQSIAITVDAVNDAPINTVPGLQSTDEDTDIVFSAANSNAISIADIDAGASLVQVTLTATHGTLTLSGTTGLTFSTGDGTADSTLVFTGTVADINAALDGLTFSPTANYNGPATIQITTDDQANSGSGGALSDSDSIAIDIGDVNDPPVNTVPGPQATPEDVNLIFSGGNGNQISIDDLDTGSSPVKVRLTVTNGRLTLSGTTGLTFTVGDGTNDTTMTFTGTLADINAALNGLIFTPSANYNGPAQLQIVTDDQGNSGAGGALTDTSTVDIDVTAVNDAPILTAPATRTLNEDQTITFVSANLISLIDVDSDPGEIQITLTATNGLLTLSGITGLTFTTGDGAADATMVFTGTVADINAALAGLIYTPNANYNGAATIQIDADDQGNTGAGGNLTDSKTINLTINAVNDAPVNTVPPAQNTNEDTALIFSTANGNAISIADVDAGSSIVRITLTVTNGVLTLGGTTGLSFASGDGTNDATMVFSGTLVDINAALDGLRFTPNANYNGPALLSITTSDQGHTGAGGTKTDTDTVAITVNAVNDAPVNTIPSAQTVAEDETLKFSAVNGNRITVADLEWDPLESTCRHASLSIL